MRYFLFLLLSVFLTTFVSLSSFAQGVNPTNNPPSQSQTEESVRGQVPYQEDSVAQNIPPKSKRAIVDNRSGFEKFLSALISWLIFAAFIYFFFRKRIRNWKLKNPNFSLERSIFEIITVGFSGMIAIYAMIRVDKSIKIRDSAGPLIIDLIVGFFTFIVAAIFVGKIVRAITDSQYGKTKFFQMTVIFLMELIFVIVLFGSLKS